MDPSVDIARVVASDSGQFIVIISMTRDRRFGVLSPDAVVFVDLYDRGHWVHDKPYYDERYARVKPVSSGRLLAALDRTLHVRVCVRP
jgi:hypothetical protein